MYRIMRMAGRIIAVAITIAIAIILISHFFGVEYTFRKGIQVVSYREEIGIKSPSGAYQLVELKDATGRFLLYCVIGNGEFAESYPLFITDEFLFPARFLRNYGWYENTD
ncbi:MAG: hypothetical protein RR337_11920, partial [Clostridia bacterium]